MTLVRWEPSRDALSLRGHMNRLFSDAFHGLGNAPESELTLGGSWAPAVDIYEKNGNIVLQAELPGMDTKDVDIRVENNTLTLTGERKRENEVENENYHRSERCYGRFTRNFSLPSTVDQGNIKAEYESGILRLTLPKREEAKPKQISISVTH